MISWVMRTSREAARRLVRWVAGTVIAVAIGSSLFAGHIGITLLTVFWALVLLGPVLAWPLTWGPLLGRGSMGVGALLIILTLSLRNVTPGETVIMIAASIPFFLIGLILMVPQHLVGLVQTLIRR